MYIMNTSYIICVSVNYKGKRNYRIFMDTNKQKTIKHYVDNSRYKKCLTIPRDDMSIRGLLFQ